MRRLKILTIAALALADATAPVFTLLQAIFRRPSKTRDSQRKRLNWAHRITEINVEATRHGLSELQHRMLTPNFMLLPFPGLLSPPLLVQKVQAKHLTPSGNDKVFA